MWRNKEWKNPHSCLGQRTKNHRKYDAYEAGADAILKELIKDGEYEHADCDDSCPWRKSITIRFIPDEEGQ